MKRVDRRIVACWLVVLVVAALVLARTTWRADMSVFLPTKPSPEQKLLITNLQQGQSARTLLASVGPLPAAQLKPMSHALVGAWRELAGVSSVSNGNPDDFAAEQAVLFKHRYLLTGDGQHDPFTEPALREQLQQARSMLASSAGLFNKDFILGDPTGAGLRSLNLLSGSGGPRRHQGVWVNGQTDALLFMLNIDVDGADLDGQEQLLTDLRAAYARTLSHAGIDGADTQLTLSGAPVFAVQSRADIRGDVVRLSSLGMALIVALLLLMFRSLRVLLIALVPLLTAVAVGAAAVALGFGSIHALTLGFGVALIGECVDYALYHLVHNQSGAGGQPGFWAPVRLGLFTSLTGFAALLFSDFPGLAQLAVLAMAGLTAGFLTTRYVLPTLTAASAPVDRFYRLEAHARRASASLVRWQPWALALVVICVIFGVLRRDALWSTDIAALNPVSAQAQQIDTLMRDALGGPDVSNMVLVRANKPGTDVLAATAAVTAALREQVQAGRLRGLQSPTDLLPPTALQQARQQQLPEPAVLQARINALAGQTGLSARALAPFIDAVGAAREQPPIVAADYTGTRLAGRLESMLTTIDERQVAIITLEHDSSRPFEPAQWQQQLQTQLGSSPAMQEASLTVLNLKARTDALYAGYIRDALRLSLAGAAAIVILLALSLRSWRALGTVCLPIGGALAIIVAGFALAGTPMHLLHLVGLLLVAAIGSNYALVLAPATGKQAGDALTLTPLLLANLTTVAGFGVLALSKVPLLAALGLTVGLGAPLVLVLAAIASARREEQVA